MERLAIDELLKWKNKQYRKPLIIEGARQMPLEILQLLGLQRM